MRLWGGNYSGDPDRAFWEFNRSFAFDRVLLAEEIAASKAYVHALERAQALSPGDASRLVAGLDEVLDRSQRDPAYLQLDSEDVHSFVETRLGEIVGDLAGQAHLGRSRNEQTVTALRLWLRGQIDRLSSDVRTLVLALSDKGLAGAEAVMPGCTHTRIAEPITFGHWAAAHVWGLVRDFERLQDARRRVDVLPLGSGALAGTALPLDRAALACDLGFAAVSENALDAVMDRDFVTEFTFACAQLQVHLSRMAEDLIWLSAPEFGFFTLPEAFTTGSSLMPQKKNPDALELVRGKSGRVTGGLVRLLTIVKGLAAGYQKDLQEDKEGVFDVAEAVSGSVAMMTGVVNGLVLNVAAMRAAGSREEMMAAGLAVALARDGLPFRQAHGLVGSLVATAQRAAESLKATAGRVLAAEAPRVAARLDELFDADAAVRAKSARGGTAPSAVRASLAEAVARVSGVASA
jgi:argininosuccinate lyase